jgi:type VI protein secretion system component VasK
MESFSLLRWISVLVITALILALSLLPMIIAIARKHQNRVGISWLNILLGFTVIGWIVALVWALGRVTPKQQT